jgi:hypothetical protein
MEFRFVSFKLIERKNIYCNNIITRPRPNSTADNTKKKNVNESKFRLSK